MKKSFLKRLGFYNLIIIVFMIVFNIKAMAEGDTIEINNVPTICQMPELPTGCESASAAMLLNWAGVKITKTEVADALPKSPVPYNSKGKLIGKHPNEFFIGSPYTSSSYGVYHKPIAALINKFTSGRAKDITGCSFDSLLSLIVSGTPVMVWATIDMQPVRDHASWYVGNNLFTWKIPEHAYVLIGYDNKDVIVNDPMDGMKKRFSRADFKDRWENMDKQAVTILDPNKLINVAKLFEEIDSSIKTTVNITGDYTYNFIMYVIIIPFSLIVSYTLQKEKSRTKKYVRVRRQRYTKS